jgi:hypothetical protein
MGREVRMVPPDWQHPREPGGGYRPLHGESWSEREEGRRHWEAGFVTDYKGGWKAKDNLDKQWSWEDYAGHHTPEDHMPDFPPGTATHFCMYETCTEGTPLSPSMPTPDALARWLADNGASAFGSDTATYEQWLATIEAGSAPAAFIIPGRGIVSGVSEMAAAKRETEP